MNLTIDETVHPHWATLDCAGRYQLFSKCGCGYEFAARRARDEFDDLPQFARLRIQEWIADQA